MMAALDEGDPVKFGNFLFPDCRDPARDGAVIDETLAEARLSDELGIDVQVLRTYGTKRPDPTSRSGAEVRRAAAPGRPWCRLLWPYPREPPSAQRR